MILRREVLAILAGNSLVLGLLGQRGDMPLMRRLFFLRRGTRLEATCSPVIAHGPRVHHHASTIDMGHARNADVGDSAVVVERSSAPLPADKAHTRIAEAVVNSAIEANVRSPVSRVPGIEPSAPSPISGSPQHADRRHDPGARHPVVAGVIVPSPIAGCPEVAWSGADRLCVNRQRWRSDSNRYAHHDLRKRRGRKR